MDIQALRRSSLFSEVTDMDLAEVACGDFVQLEKDTVLFREGEPVKHFYVVIEGTLRVFRIMDGSVLPISDFTAGMTGGEVPLLSGTPHLANAVAATDLTLFQMNVQAFWQLLGNCPSVRQKILADMAKRNSDFQLLTFQRQKLMSLGTMAAGLAHELNNPAAAARRSARSLNETLIAFDAHSTTMLKGVMFKAEECQGDPFQPVIDRLQLDDFELNSLEQSDREDELGDWLEEIGDVEEPWDVAATLVSVSYTRDFLETFAERLRPEYVAAFVNWLAKDVQLRLLAQELGEATTRISDLIAAMKSYSYMDQTLEKSKVDLHAGIINTLKILKHKLRKKNINVVKRFAEDLPLVSAYGSELNQVWTNLLDNAIDAVPEGGQITITSQRERVHTDQVSIHITDNGSGMSPAVLSRIFEPFYTTKGVGQGTGMGLDITHKIVVNVHKGDIRVTSQPGKTTFIVCLPIDLP